jgi:hypothetical protein
VAPLRRRGGAGDPAGDTLRRRGLAARLCADSAGGRRAGTRGQAPLIPHPLRDGFLGRLHFSRRRARPLVAGVWGALHSVGRGSRRSRQGVVLGGVLATGCEAASACLHGARYQRCGPSARAGCKVVPPLAHADTVHCSRASCRRGADVLTPHPIRLRAPLIPHFALIYCSPLPRGTRHQERAVPSRNDDEMMILSPLGPVVHGPAYVLITLQDSAARRSHLDSAAQTIRAPGSDCLSTRTLDPELMSGIVRAGLLVA